MSEEAPEQVLLIKCKHRSEWQTWSLDCHEFHLKDQIQRAEYTCTALIDAAISAAVDEERERCAGIAMSAFMPAHTYASENADNYRAFDIGQRDAIRRIYAAIRESARTAAKG